MITVKRIIKGLLIAFGVLYILPLLLLQNSAVQRFLSIKVSNYLERRIGSEVEIKSISPGLFRELILKDVLLKDPNGDTILVAKRISAGFEITPLLNKQFRFHSCKLFSFDMRLARDTTGAPLNIQYIIDAFAKKDTTAKEPVEIQIESLDARFGTFSYREKDFQVQDSLFNFKAFVINNITSKIAFNKLTDGQLDLKVEQLGFSTPEGIELNNLQFNLVADSTTANVNRLRLKLLQSELSLSDLSIIYADADGPKPVLEVPFQLTIDDSRILPSELTRFFPRFRKFNEPIAFRGKFKGNLKNFRGSDLHAQMGKDLIVNTEALFRNIFSQKKDDPYIFVEIENSLFSQDGISRLINYLNDKPLVIPKQVTTLNTIRFSGEGSITRTSAVAEGSFNTAVGSFTTNIEVGRSRHDYLRGRIKSDSLNLAAIINDRRFGRTAFNLVLNASQTDSTGIAGTIEGTIRKFPFQGYNHENISLNGRFTNTEYDGNVGVNSPDGKLTANGLFKFDKNNSEFHFTANVEDLNPYNLHLTQKFPETSLSMNLEADFSGLQADNLLGKIDVSDFKIKTDKGLYSIDSLTVISEQHGQERTLSVQSDILNGELHGQYDLSAIASNVQNTISEHLPSLITSKNPTTADNEQNYSLKLQIGDLKSLSEVMSLPIVLLDTTSIYGEYCESDNRYHIDANIPRLLAGNYTVENTNIRLSSNPEILLLEIDAFNRDKNNTLTPITTSFSAAKNNVRSAIEWGKPKDKYRGKVYSDTRFSNIDGQIEADINVQKSTMIFNDSVWTLDPTIVAVSADGLSFNRLKASHNEQFVKINGAISHDENQQLNVELNKVNLEYIFNSLNIKALEFGGIASGDVTLQDIFNTRQISTHLDVKDFSFNQGLFGDLDLTGTWDPVNNGVLMSGYVKKPGSEVIIYGVIYPVSETISINFDADHADAYFLRKYLNNVAKDLSGSFSGRLRLFGDLNNPTVEGKVFAHQCRFGVDFLNTYYSFSDTVFCSPDEISLKNTLIFDDKRKPALANAYVKHNLFTDFRFKADISFNDFMIYNAPKKQNPLFFGTAFGSGNANLKGTENQIDISVSLRNTDNTHITLNFMEEPEVSNYDFIEFKSKADKNLPANSDNYSLATAQKPQTTAVGTDIKLNLMLDVMQDATFDIIMDPVSGDKISGYGTGNLQIQYGSKTPLKVIGNYKIDRGKYNFSWQQAIYRDFVIQEGSDIKFNGDPYQANLDIVANFTAQANLGDLDRKLLELQQSAKGNIPVNCVLKLKGQLEHPDIKFDIDLPNSTDELNQQVKSYFRTDDLLNQQILYLLVLNRFYTAPEYLREDARTSNNLSYLTSTLSSQLSNVLGSLTNDKFQLGAKYHQAYEYEQTSTEMELLLESRLLDNRLIINGNFGYIDRPYLQQENQTNIPLIGDFDLEYLLNKNGNLRLKFFNHYNYRYLSPRPEMTQGLGVLVRREFDNLGELGRKKK